jgi:hypothetical protein
LPLTRHSSFEEKPSKIRDEYCSYCRKIFIK